MELGTLQLAKLIVHEVPNRPTNGGGSPVIHSQVESALDAELRNYFREKIIASLQSAGFQVKFESHTPSPVPDLVSDYLLGKTSDFVSMSQRIADHLYESQTGVNSAGLLCLAEVALAGMRGIAILKVDKESAVRVEPVNLEGNSTFNLEHVRNLMLSQRTRVFKAGLFAVQPSPGISFEVHGTVSDNQRGYAPLTEVADFFLRRFLGCTLVGSPDVTTKQFFQATEGFIATEVSDPETKAQYETALLAELNSQSAVVDPITFAERNLSLEHRQGYRDWLLIQEVPAQQFEKDTVLIKTRIKRISVDFVSGVGVQFPPSALEEEVRISELDDGRTYLEVRDRLSKMEGKQTWT